MQRQAYIGQLEIIALKAHTRGYHGCVVEADEYVFFQLTRKGNLRRLKAYPRGEFSDHEQFQFMMMKYMTPSAFMTPPEPIEAITLEELDRVYRIVRKRALEI
jgi:hypothetical protein